MVLSSCGQAASLCWRTRCSRLKNAEQNKPRHPSRIRPIQLRRRCRRCWIGRHPLQSGSVPRIFSSSGKPATTRCKATCARVMPSREAARVKTASTPKGSERFNRLRSEPICCTSVISDEVVCSGITPVLHAGGFTGSDPFCSRLVSKRDTPGGLALLTMVPIGAKFRNQMVTKWNQYYKLAQKVSSVYTV